MHEVLPTGAVDPTGHGVQAMLPARLANVSAGQAVHSALPLRENVPGAQRTHAALPAFEY